MTGAPGRPPPRRAASPRTHLYSWAGRGLAVWIFVVFYSEMMGWKFSLLVPLWRSGTAKHHRFLISERAKRDRGEPGRAARCCCVRATLSPGIASFYPGPLFFFLLYFCNLAPIVITAMPRDEGRARAGPPGQPVRRCQRRSPGAARSVGRTADLWDTKFAGGWPGWPGEAGPRRAAAQRRVVKILFIMFCARRALGCPGGRSA